MDGGGSMQSNEERGAEKLMDDYLRSIGLHRKKIAKDGSCLFRAVAEQVLHCQSLHTEVRAKCVEFLKRNRETYEAFIEGDFEDYLLKLQDPQQWVGEVEINALAVIYQKDFMIFQEPGKPAVNITDNNFKDKVRLCFLNGNHYDSVYPVSHLKNAALCQSILYELLYDNVFKVDRSSLTLCQRVGRPTDLVSDDGMNPCASSDESDLDAGEQLWVQNGTTTNTRYRGRGRGRQLNERVRRSLNPTLLRNIEYDVWQKSKRAQQKMDYCIAAGMQFTAGDRCQVRLEANGRSYNATVKDVPPNSGSVIVYIEELGRKQVPLWSLRPPKDENSWSTVVTRDKRLSNGHGEWEERGKGRGRGKYVPASSVSQTTAPGSSGRVQKQHSWPSQATVDEQGGGKANRALKSVSSMESAFGITPELLKAKEEEEMNVALVEIQLRDEDSFPALGAQSGLQGDGGKKKGGEKRRSQRNKTKSPVEDIRAPSPSAGERPKSSTPPPADAAAAAPPTNTTTPSNPTPPAAAPPVTSHSSPACPSSLKASAPNTNMSAATTTTRTTTTTTTTAAPAAPAAAPSCAAPTKTSTSSSAAGAPLGSPPAAAPSSKPPVKGGAVPPSVPSSACLFSFLFPPSLPAASSPPTPGVLSSPSPPASSSASPPPSSSLPPPTFIAPIAPSPAEAQGILPRSSPPVSALRHSPSPPTTSSSTSSTSQLRQAAPDAPPVSAPTLNSLTKTGPDPAAPQTLQSPASLSQVHPQVSQTQTQSSLTQSESQTHPSLPPNQTSMPQIQTEAQTSLHQTQASVTHLQPQSQAQYLPQSQPEVTQVPSSQLPPVSTSVQPHPPQPPHPSQVPHPSLSLSTSPLPSLPTQNTQNQTEASLPPTQPQPDSPPHPPQQSHPPQPPHHPHVQSAPPPHPQSIQGAVPLQQLSQLYQDPLYPGFPQGEKGEVVPPPPMSSSKSGDDLPQDVNVLRFFFNLGVKSYSMPMFPPYIYLLPLQQAHTVHPKFPSRSPSPAPAPHYPAPNRPPSHQEAYSQYPPTSAAVGLQYDHQAPLAEPAHPGDHSYNQAGYPVAQSPHQRMPCPSLSWQHHQMPPPRNPNFTVGYPAPSPPYPVHQPMSQGYHAGQGSGHPMYPASVSPYPPSSLGYQSSPAHEEIQVSQGPMEQRQPTNGDTVPGQGSRRVPGPSAANLANANNSRAVVVPSYALTKEPGDGLTRTVLLVDPPLNPNNPILVSNPGVKDVPVSMTTIKTGSTPGSPIPYDINKTTFPGDNNPTRGYRGHQKLLPPSKMVSLGAPEPGQVSYLSTGAMAEPLSVGCSTEDDWDEQPGYKPPPPSYRGQRRNPRAGGGGRGRGSSDQGRGSYRRRHGGDAGGGYGYIQYNSSYRGRGRERGY